MKVSRLNSIEQYVISRETVSIDELCEVFGVSKNTIPPRPERAGNARPYY